MKYIRNFFFAQIEKFPVMSHFIKKKNWEYSNEMHRMMLDLGYLHLLLYNIENLLNSVQFSYIIRFLIDFQAYKILIPI